MTIKWSDKDVADRLLAAVLASYNNQIKYEEVARFFGQGATNSAIENRLRKPKKMATQLRKEAEAAVTKSKSESKSNLKCPDKKGGVAATSAGTSSDAKGVKPGRISKTNHVVRRKKNIKIQEKEDEEEDEDEDEDSEEYV